MLEVREYQSVKRVSIDISVSDLMAQHVQTMSAGTLEIARFARLTYWKVMSTNRNPPEENQRADM